MYPIELKILCHFSNLSVKILNQNLLNLLKKKLNLILSSDKHQIYEFCVLILFLRLYIKKLPKKYWTIHHVNEFHLLELIPPGSVSMRTEFSSIPKAHLSSWHLSSPFPGILFLCLVLDILLSWVYLSFGHSLTKDTSCCLALACWERIGGKSIFLPRMSWHSPLTSHWLRLGQNIELLGWACFLQKQNPEGTA